MFGLGRQPDRIIKRSGSGSRQQPKKQDFQQGESTGSGLSPQDHYAHAKAIYEETRDPEHWQYMQRCADKLK